MDPKWFAHTLVSHRLDYGQKSLFRKTNSHNIITDHCLEILRQKLTCDADVGVVTANWVARRHTAWPNFNTWHTCRNFDGVVEWSKEHNAPYYGHPLRRPGNIAGLEPPP